jgi:hypothetical protein
MLTGYGLGRRRNRLQLPNPAILMAIRSRRLGEKR